MTVDGPDEAISPSRECLDEPRRVRRVAERVAQAVDDGVQAMVEIPGRAGRREPLSEFVARDEVARPLQQQRQDLEGLFLKIDPDARLPQLAGPAVQF
jgi:hypothetical protein